MSTPLLDGAKNGFDPGQSYEANYVIRGKPGTGKTTIACGCPYAVHGDCDPSGAGRFVVNGRSQRVGIRDAAMFDAFIKELIEDATKKGDDRRFKVVILDPAGQILNFCRQLMCKKLGVTDIEGFDHGKVASLFRKYLLDLNAVGYYWILIDHELDTRMPKSGGTEIILTEPLLPQSINKFVEQDCHHILTMKLEPESVAVKDNKGLLRQETKLTHRITTKPGRKTSLANPKARIWLPEVITGLPETGDSADIWDYFDNQCQQAIARMYEQVNLKSKMQGKN